MEIVVPAEIVCPYCGEVFSVQIDTSEAEQSLVEDCAVCCRPIYLTVRCGLGQILDLKAAI